MMKKKRIQNHPVPHFQLDCNIATATSPAAVVPTATKGGASGKSLFSGGGSGNDELEDDDVDGADC
eukprot:15329504-Ditylum_brightwellii.AAC.1